MEYVMKGGGFLHPRDSNVHQEGWSPPIHPTPYHLDYSSAGRLFPLVRFAPSSPSLSLSLSLSLCLFIVHLRPLDPPLDPTRHALYVRFVPSLPLFCMPLGTQTAGARARARERERERGQSSKDTKDVRMH